jgi:type I restriction enzyme S subunit
MNSSGWPLVPLGKLAQVIAGQSPPGDTYRSEPVGLPFFQGKVDFGDIHPVVRVWCDSPKKIALPGDVLISVRAPVGPTNVADMECCIGRGLAAIRCGSELSNSYLLYFLRWIEPELAATGSGSTFQSINREDLIELRMLLPPTALQERIAAGLTSAMTTVEKARRAAKERLAAAEALPAAYLREVFEGEEAESWKSVKLGQVISRHNEIIHPGERKEGEAIFVGLEHIEAHSGRRIGANVVDYRNMTGRKPTFRKGQIVYGYLRPYLNKVWIADFDGCSSVDQFAFDVDPDKADIVYIAAFMRSETFLRRSEVVTTTGQLPRVSIDEILSVKFELPPLAEQQRIAATLSKRLATVETLIASCRAELKAVEAMPAALLREIFCGVAE